MTVAALANPTAPPEMFWYDQQRSPSVKIGVLELEDSHWLALPPGFHVDAPRFDTREAALRAAIARTVHQARRYMRAKDGEGTRWTEGYAGRIIEWALLLKEEGLVQAATADAEAPIDHPGSEVAASADDRVIEDSASGHSGSLNQPTAIDPVIRSLCESHHTRKIFPAGHTFAMTNPVINGHMVTLGTCSCGETFSYAYGSAGHERMDAAIEAHWQKFDCVADKIDGRGEPIGGEAPASKPKRKKKSQPDAPGQPASIASAPDSAGIHGADAPYSDIADAAPRAMRSVDDASASRREPAPHAPPSGAGSPLLEDAPIGAGLVAADMAAEPQDDWSELLRAATDLAWREPPKVTETQKAMLDFSKVYVSGEVTRPILRWHGGKWKLAPWIIQHFPPHRIYCEPFGGAGSVLLRKKSALSEIYNDLDTEVVNLFRVLRSADAGRLIELLRLTPFARGEFDEAFEFIDDCVERARRLIVRSFFAGGSRGVLDVDRTMAGFNGGSARSRGDSPNSSHSRDWSNYADTLPAAVARLTSVVIDNRPAIDLMKQHDSEETLFYVDPPYLADTRSDRARKAYRFELNDDEHRELLGFLKTLDGMVILSGYASPVYDDALPGWRRVEREAMADGAQPRVEILWINPHCTAALDEQHPALFDMAAHDVANTPPPRRQQPSGG